MFPFKERLHAKKKIFLDFFGALTSDLIAGRNYEAWKAKHYQLKRVRIKNTKLAKELARAALKKGGVLTFAEFMEIDQYGKQGYQATHTLKAHTRVAAQWSRALAMVARVKGLNYILDFGFGDGTLGLEMLKQGRRKGSKLSFMGVEISPKLREEAIKRFARHGFADSVKIASSIAELRLAKRGPCLAVFAYSLDSIPSEMFYNSRHTVSQPNALIGLSVDKNIVYETVLSGQMLKRQGLKLANGIFTDSLGRQFDLSSWRLQPGQRAFIPTPAFSYLSQVTSALPPGSLIVIIDEFCYPTPAWEINHLCPPRDLLLFRRDCDLTKLYEAAGENLLYFTFYFNSLVEALFSLGLTTIFWDREDKFSYCFALLATKTKDNTSNRLYVGPSMRSKRFLAGKYRIIEGYPR